MKRALKLLTLYCSHAMHIANTWVDDQIEILGAEREIREVARSFGSPDRNGEFDVSAAIAADRGAMLWKEVARSRHLVRIANAHNIALPPRESRIHWAEVPWDIDQSQPLYLTTDGLAEIVPKVLAVKKHRREAFTAIAAACTGVVGAITGLVAVVR